MPTVEKKYTQDVPEGRQEYQGNHDIYEMPDKEKPRRLFGGAHVSSRSIVTILILVLFIVAIGAIIIEILKRSQGFA